VVVESQFLCIGISKCTRKTSLCFVYVGVHVFICMIFLVSILLGAHLVVHDIAVELATLACSSVCAGSP
jgi:hypothetical protein